MSDPSLPLPLLMPPLERPPWPAPPFAWPHVPAPANDVPQRVTLEMSWGATMDGEMVDFDAEAWCLKFRLDARGPVAMVPFSRLRRLLVEAALRCAPAPHGRAAPLPAAAQERTVRLAMADGRALHDQTLGHVASDAGLYLWTPVDEERALRRVFLPRCAYTALAFEPTAAERAAERWVCTRAQLLDALERQDHAPLLRTGEALLALGLVTPEQLARALARQRGDVPIGEMLVSAGLITPADLKTALAHKMGYPLVDLTRYPIDPAAVRRLPMRVAIECRALALAADGARLIVATDRPSRLDKLRELRVVTGMRLVPVLAPRGQLVQALSALAQQDVWPHHAFARAMFAPTTA
jgi:hypothetical protein